MRKKTLLVGLKLAFFAGLVAFGRKIRSQKQQLDQVSTAGYETAPDVLFPGKKKENKHLKYGPVLPS